MLMTIAIDIRHTGDDHFEEYISFLFRLLKIVVTKNPGHEFIFISGRPMQTKLLFDNNVTVVITGPQIRNILLRKIWYDIKIPALLRKYKADVFIAANGICSLNTSCPLCLIVNDLSFLHFSSPIKKASLFFLKRETKKFLDTANIIVTFSEFVKKEIVLKFATSEEKITVVPPAGKESFYPLDENEKEEIKKKYTGGKNYFIYTGVIHPQKNLINLMKAFSVFKKRQKSDWKLVLAGSLDKSYKNFANNLKTYKYRDDVLMMACSEEEAVRLKGAAYAFIYPSFYEGNGAAVLDAINSHIPVITSFNSSMQEIAGEAALYVDPADHNDIADKMMLLYKDESLRNSLIEKGKIVAAQYNLEKTADLFWQSILKAYPAPGKNLK